MKAAIITIGNEILLGKTLNSNMAFLGAELAKLGIPVDYAVVIKDDPEAINKALEDTWGKYDVVISTGGLGPTEDDLTKAAIAGFFGVGQHFDEQIWQHVQAMFSKRGMATPQTNISQAMVPDGFIPLRNDRGTAPGLHYSQGDKHFFALQGVPLEMKFVFSTSIAGILQKGLPGLKPIWQRTIRTHGISESALAEKFKLEQMPEGVYLAWLPQTGRVDMRFYGPDEVLIEMAMKRAMQNIKSYVWGYDDNSPAQVLLELLWKKSNTISVAESCTGGLVQKLLTDIPGASKAFIGGIIAYSNEVKENAIKVSPETLNQYGAVSEEVALEMARGIKALTGTSYAVATTGIAGPDGGTAEKPVGTVCFGFIAADVKWSSRQIFTGDRGSIRLKAAEFSILALIKYEQGRS